MIKEYIYSVNMFYTCSTHVIGLNMFHIVLEVYMYSYKHYLYRDDGVSKT